MNQDSTFRAARVSFAFDIAHVSCVRVGWEQGWLCGIQPDPLYEVSDISRQAGQPLGRTRIRHSEQPGYHSRSVTLRVGLNKVETCM